MDLAFVILLFLSPLGASAYTASALSRWMISRHKRPSLLLIPLVTGFVGLLAVLCVFQGDLFHPNHWETAKMDLRLMVPMCFVAAAFFALWPALGIVIYYHETFRPSQEPPSSVPVAVKQLKEAYLELKAPKKDGAA